MQRGGGGGDDAGGGRRQWGGGSGGGVGVGECGEGELDPAHQTAGGHPGAAVLPSDGGGAGGGGGGGAATTPLSPSAPNVTWEPQPIQLSSDGCWAGARVRPFCPPRNPLDILSTYFPFFCLSMYPPPSVYMYYLHIYRLHLYNLLIFSQLSLAF